MVTISFGLFLQTLLVIVAVAIVRSRDLFVSVMLSGIFSLLMAGNFLILDAADVALTEAAVGAGISTVLLLSALALTAEREKRPKIQRWVPLGVTIATTLTVVYAMLGLPPLGDGDAPLHQHVGAFYLERTGDLIDIPNVVTAVLASFRGYDTLGEVFVVFTAGLGVMFVLGAGRVDAVPDAAHAEEIKIKQGLRHHLIPQIVGRVLIPFILLFALYVQFHGEYSPGGGFQAGALFAAGIILYGLLQGERSALRVMPPVVLRTLMVSGVLLYAGVGVATMLLGGAFLDYGVLAEDPVAGQHLGILVVELGVGLTVTGVLLSIFHAFAAR
jgi:multicomponent Na+:H+ antiporter subunit B